ncbi:hypothetical protein SASPL_123143 [Salvia splendens]|uniref:Ribulose bisphosphate carboxylase/oxygenase activase AAA helical domain-containing protein n=1 Tax=Salvia splendens TaxID=180675 RepID=A0A8X8XPN9_SALSN|nr:hypothetical protein SASPL_123143 [Salvia splendens]
MALCFQISPSSIKSQLFSNPKFYAKKPSNFFTICCTHSEGVENATSKQQKKLSKQSSWEAEDSEAKDYLYRLGAEADNMNIAVGARAGIIDDLFTGNFLGKDSDIVFDYRQKATRSFEYLQGDYYIAPAFLDKVVVHMAKNFMAHQLNVRVPLILGIWGGKGQGKTFQTELIFRALGVEPIIMSAGELESERAGEPGRLIHERYRTASQVVQNQEVAGLYYVGVGLRSWIGTDIFLPTDTPWHCAIEDNPTRVSIGQGWREADITHRIPIIVTGNDFARIYAPLIRDGRMDKFYWQPTEEDIVNIVSRMYEKDGITNDEVVSIVQEFPNQGANPFTFVSHVLVFIWFITLDFYGALRSRTYDRSILEWVNDAGGAEDLGTRLLKQKRDGKLPVFTPPQQTLEALLESGYDLIKEQKLIMETKLSKEYLKNMDDEPV